MSDDLLERARARFGQAEVYRLESESHPVSFEANKLKEIMRRDQSGVALRVIHDGRIGFTSTTNPELEDALVDRAGNLATYGSEARFEFPCAAACPPVNIYDPALDGLSEEAMIETGRGLIERLRAEWPDLLCDARIGRSSGRMHISNSSGVDYSYQQSSYGVSLGGQLIRGTDMLNVWAGHASSGYFGDEETDRILDIVLTALDRSREIVSAPVGDDIPVVFTPRGVASTFIGPLMSGFNGKNVATGASPLTDKGGEKMLDERISVYDDPLLPMASGSRPCDDEGVPSQRVTLIESGVIGEALFDLQTAGQSGKRTTGSAHRGLASTPSPGSSVIDISPGETPPEELYAGIKQGLIVESLLGAGQGNELGGAFRANVSLGYRIENGEIVGRVKDTMISGNVYETLKQVEAVSSEAEWVFGSLRSPAIRCRGVEVATQ